MELFLAQAQGSEKRTASLRILKSGDGRAKIYCGSFFGWNFFHKEGRRVFTPAMVKVRKLGDGRPAIAILWPGLPQYCDLLAARERHGQRFHLELPLLD
jgi:hypothetical protein